MQQTSFSVLLTTSACASFAAPAAPIWLLLNLSCAKQLVTVAVGEHSIPVSPFPSTATVRIHRTHAVARATDYSQPVVSCKCLCKLRSI